MTILFLDDMESRHAEFGRLSVGKSIVPVWTAHQAIRELNTRRFDQVFLDHDLSESDIMSKPGEKTLVPSGMTVVDHILEMESPPQDIVVHSCNGPAREEMVRRLKESGRIKRVRGIPFPELIRLIRPDGA